MIHMPEQSTKSRKPVAAVDQQSVAQVADKPSTAMADFLKNVKAIIEARNIKISKLAEGCGIARPWLSTVIHGRASGSITLENADRIAQSLGVPLSELLKPSKKLSGKSDKN